MYGGKIFVIEDDINILSALEAKLAHEGFKVETDAGAGETEHLLSRMEIFRPDYIVMDLVLPRMDGAELLYAIRAAGGGGESAHFYFYRRERRRRQGAGREIGRELLFREIRPQYRRVCR